MPRSPIPVRSGSPCYNYCPRLDHPDVGQTGWNVHERLNSKVDYRAGVQPVTQILKRHTTTPSSTACDWLVFQNQRVKTPRKLNLSGSKENHLDSRKSKRGGDDNMTRVNRRVRSYEVLTKKMATFEPSIPNNFPQEAQLVFGFCQFPSSVSPSSTILKTALFRAPAPGTR